MPETPSAHTQFYERRRVAWDQAQAEFDSRTWPFRVVGDAQEWARTWLPAEMADAPTAALDAAYVRSDLPGIPYTPYVFFPEALIRKAVDDGVVVLPAPGRLTSTYVHRDEITEQQTATGYGLYVADSDVLEIRAAGGVIWNGELGCSDGSPLLGAAAIERVVHQIIDTLHTVRPFLQAGWDTAQ
ncbi:hypothetical protein [Rhodococcus sp. ARC_M6]|uniref:hypothetical protein n=1 Tax=Rhodococcus sp. ARC_M6 TaxID=2928852 RepID=UPI001FB30E93|nr:hypothetical protein [Rhodococcus sp. ARC_M6]MCJ0907119.1 hypothetical protein [Rhodococcus sp. ARC_M6]